MTDPAGGLLAALHLADGTLPIGRFVQSAGLEVLLESVGEGPDDAIAQIVRAHVTRSVGPVDAVFVAAAHRTATAPQALRDRVTRLAELDRMLAVRRTSAVAREASESCGRRLAAIAPGLLDDGPPTSPEAALVAAFVDRVTTGGTDGNLAVVSGALAAAMGTTVEQAVTVEVRSAASGMLSAAVRLGRMPASRAHVLLAASTPWLARAARDALDRTVDDTSSCAFELEIAMTRRARTGGWTFAS